ncbi:MAG: helix-turn-helix domain-containing protein [Acidimicrobiales bacterium]
MTANGQLDCLLTPDGVSAYLGVPVGTLANWRYMGRGPAYLRVGRHIRYRQSAIAAWTESLSRGAEHRQGPRVPW